MSPRPCLKSNLRSFNYPFIFLCIALATTALLASYTINRELPFYDDGVYLINAKSIASGFGYRNLSLPDSPPQGKYPPFFPFLLSLMWHVSPSFPENLLIMKSLILATGLVFLSVAYAYLREFPELRGPLPAAIVAMVGLHPLFLELTTQIMSDIPYALISMLAILFYRGFLENKRLSWFAMAAALGLAAFLTRSFGIILVAAMGIHLLFFMKRYRLALGFAVSSAAVVIPWFVWSWMARTAYLHYPPEIAMNYTDYLANFLPADSTFSFLRYISVNFGSLIINWASFIFPEVSPFVGGPIALMVIYHFARNFRQQLNLHDLYCVLSLLILLFWPWPANDRFLLVISPFLIAYFFMGMKLLTSRLLLKHWPAEMVNKISRAAIAFVIFGALVHNLIAYRNHREISHELLPVYREFHQTIEWIADNIPTNAVVVAHDDPVYYLFADKKAVRISYANPFAISYAEEVVSEFPRAGKLVEWFRKINACYLVENPLTGDGQRLYYSNLIQAIKRSTSKSIRPLYVSKSGLFVVYKFNNCP